MGKQGNQSEVLDVDDTMSQPYTHNPRTHNETITYVKLESHNHTHTQKL